EQAGEQGAGQAEEHQQHLGVGGVLPRRAESGGEIVADLRGPGRAGLEVVRRREDPGIGRRWIRRQAMVQSDVDLGAHQVGPGRVRSSPGSAVRYAAGRPRTTPAPVVWVLPAVVAASPDVRAKPTVSIARTPAVFWTACITRPTSAPECTCTCQSTVTPRTA